MTSAGIITHCRQAAAIGIEHMVFNVVNIHEIKPLETFAKEVIPAVAGF